MSKTSAPLVICLLVCSAFACLAPPSRGQATWTVEFSADQVVYDPGYPEPVIQAGRVYVGKGKMRTEMTTPGGSMVTIFDPDKKSVWLLDLQQKVAADMRVLVRQSTVVSKWVGMALAWGASTNQSFKPLDPSHPCAELRAATCEKVGTEVINGRSTEKWEFTQNLDGRIFKSYQWIDSKLYISIKSQDEEGVRELRNIKEGPQPTSLFEVPSDYHITRSETTEAAKPPLPDR